MTRNVPFSKKGRDMRR